MKRNNTGREVQFPTLQRATANKAIMEISIKIQRCHILTAKAIQAMRMTSNLKLEAFKKGKCHIDQEMKVLYHACKMLKT